jgi:hypothetical protein
MQSVVLNGRMPRSSSASARPSAPWGSDGLARPSWNVGSSAAWPGAKQPARSDRADSWLGEQATASGGRCEPGKAEPAGA